MSIIVCSSTAALPMLASKSIANAGSRRAVPPSPSDAAGGADGSASSGRARVALSTSTVAALRVSPSACSRRVFEPAPAPEGSGPSLFESTGALTAAVGSLFGAALCDDEPPPTISPPIAPSPSRPRFFRLKCASESHDCWSERSSALLPEAAAPLILAPLRI